MPLYDRLILAYLLFEIPKLMAAMWVLLIAVKFASFQNDWFVYLTYAMYLMNMIAQLLLPCIVMEMIKSQVESARIGLHHRMMKESDAKKAELYQLLKYMSARRLYHKAWRVIPLDMQLPLAVIGTLLIFEVPKMMMQVWGVLQLINLGINWFVYVTYAVLAAHMMSRLIWPCIFTEMIKSQLKAARLSLYHRMLQEPEAKRPRIQELLEYTSVRRLQHSAWRVIPLDMNLPVFVLSTCVTYLVIIVQFSHLYDDTDARRVE
ncbi:hypothetical protein O0L34_g8587 [Tuta absoluta]|nr:hypothetical protein O0L34_g8587 [Tuta absoluta]